MRLFVTDYVTFFVDVTFDEEDDNSTMSIDYDEVDERITTEQPATTTAYVDSKAVYRTCE